MSNNKYNLFVINVKSERKVSLVYQRINKNTSRYRLVRVIDCNENFVMMKARVVAVQKYVICS